MARLTMRDTGRRHVCSVYKCNNNKTYMIQRGERSSFDSLFLCADCIRGILSGYIAIVGTDAARDTLSDALATLTPPERREESVDGASAAPAIPERPTRRRAR